MVRILCVAAFFIAAAILLDQPEVRQEILDIDRLHARFRDRGFRSQLLFILSAAGINALGVPRLWVSAMAGTLFGAVEGTLLALVATLLGCSTNFFMGRYLLRGPVVRRMPLRMKKWYEFLNRNGFKAILYSRMFPFTNATITNLLGGTSKIRFSHFLAATVIGYLPFTIAFATLGSSAAKQSRIQLLIGITLFAGVGLVHWIISRKSRDLEAQA